MTMSERAAFERHTQRAMSAARRGRDKEAANWMAEADRIRSDAAEGVRTADTVVFALSAAVIVSILAGWLS